MGLSSYASSISPGCDCGALALILGHDAGASQPELNVIARSPEGDVAISGNQRLP
jgi:hypothetical protein